jgi:hypothetical protein
MSGTGQSGQDWPCEAYGPDAPPPARCFVAQPGQRRCLTLDACKAVTAGEAYRLYVSANELALTGDPAFVELARHWGRPDQVFGGGE